MHFCKRALYLRKCAPYLKSIREREHVHVASLLSTKEPYMSATEPYISAKEHYISANEPHTSRVFVSENMFTLPLSSSFPQK